jgi:4-amino-4-deoxy-L-arabinose transferase-like glycosyltransferase
MEIRLNPTAKRPLSTTLTLLALWLVFYGSFTLFKPALLDDADSVHAEVAREMLLRHDYVTLYANGIRYLEKAPLLYWSMALCMRVAQMLGHSSARALAVAARIPLALTVLALAFAVEAFARRGLRSFGQDESSTRAGLYAALMLLSSPGIFLFTRITIPDAMVCLWLTLALLAFWTTEQNGSTDAGVTYAAQPDRGGRDVKIGRLPCYGFAACCALNVLTKGLIGIVFPIAIVLVYLLLTRGLRAAFTRIRQLHPLSSTLVFLAIAAPWHILIALANPTQGHPGALSFNLHTSPHWQVPLPTDGNVHGWAWFYFVNEQVLRYLNLRVPRDYDTVPLWLFWGLCLIWLMPWSAFVFHAVARAVPLRTRAWRQRLWTRSLTSHERTLLFLAVWAALPLLFFSLSTRQEYYVLPALPALILLIAAWLASRSPSQAGAQAQRAAAFHCITVLAALGAGFAVASIDLILHARPAAPGTGLAALLQQNPGDYAMSMGHFLDLDAQALGLFRVPLEIAAISLLGGPLLALVLRRREVSANPVKRFFQLMTMRRLGRPFARWASRKRHVHAANLALAAGAFGFLLAAHLGLQTFAPVLSSAQLAEAIAPQLAPRPGELPALIVIHQEYEYGSTLGFYLQRPSYHFAGLLNVPVISPGPHAGQSASTPPTREELARVRWKPIAVNPIHILTDADYRGTLDYGRSSNLWYGSFFPDAPDIFETTQSLAQKWRGPQRIFLWQDLAGEPSALPAALTPEYVIARSGGKEIVSNQPDPEKPHADPHR